MNKKLLEHFKVQLRRYTLLLVAMSLIVVFVMLWRNEIESVHEEAKAVAHNLASQTNADLIAEYASGREMDDYFESLTKIYMDTWTNFTDVFDIYLFCPVSSEKIVYLLDIYEEDGQQFTTQAFGTEDDFTYELQKNAKTLYEQGVEPKRIEISLFTKYGSALTAYAPIYNSTGALVGFVGVDFNFNDVFFFVLKMALILIVIISALGAIMSSYELKIIDRDIITPIKNVEKTAIAFAGSDHDGNSDEYRLDVVDNSENEVNNLSRSMNKMMEEIDRYINNIATITAEKERISAELNVARDIQAGAIPRIFPAFPDRHEFDIYATMNAAKEVGGDFYDFFFIDDDHLGLVMADVSGKGVPAALFMMISKTLIKDQSMFSTSPAEILGKVNDLLCEQNDADMFVTVWLGILEISTGHMIAANAGHEYPVIRRGNGKFELIKDKHGLVLGGMEGLKFKDYEIDFAPGDAIFTYTDGVPEATNIDEVLFGTDRMLDSLNINSTANVNDLLKTVKNSVDDFVQEAPQFDDITMLALEYYGPQGKVE